MIEAVNPRHQRLLGWMLVGLALFGVFFVAGPHDVFHDDAESADCQLCFVHATESPDPVHVGRPVLHLAHALELEGGTLDTEWDWSASDPRGPPVRV